MKQFTALRKNISWPISWTIITVPTNYSKQKYCIKGVHQSVTAIQPETNIG